MTQDESRVHGSIFYLLKKFVLTLYSEKVWKKFLKESGLPGTQEFVMTESYPLQHIVGIVKAASKQSGLSVHTLQEKFGEWLVPDLFQVYSSYVNPEWRTFEVLVNTEEVFHGAVRKLNSTAQPPVLHVSEVRDDYLIIDYYSKRRMGALAVGIIKGIAKYYKEEQQVEILPTTEPDAERVQIKVIFHNRTQSITA